MIDWLYFNYFEFFMLGTLTGWVLRGLFRQWVDKKGRS